MQPGLIGDRMASPIADQRASYDRRLSGTRTKVRVAESCAKRPTASRWWTRRSLKWSRCMRKLGKFQFAGDNGVVDTIQDEADEKSPLPDSKIRPIGPA